MTQLFPTLLAIAIYLGFFIAFVVGMVYVISNRINKKKVERFDQRKN